MAVSNPSMAVHALSIGVRALPGRCTPRTRRTLDMHCGDCASSNTDQHSIAAEVSCPASRKVLTS